MNCVLSIVLDIFKQLHTEYSDAWWTLMPIFLLTNIESIKKLSVLLVG